MNELNATELNDYLKYRGKCKEMSEAAVVADPSLTLVRGHYHCPLWGKQPHWWTTRQDGTVYDPTKNQFSSKGIGEYVPFNGTVSCEQCGKEVHEDDATFYGNFAFCSGECVCRCVGI